MFFWSLACTWTLVCETTDLQALPGKFLGALARSGWLPQGFALRSPGVPDSGYENKRHIGALARLGWMSTVKESPNYYYRGGRGRDFRPPSFRGPRAFFLKSDIESRHCQCKRDSQTRFVYGHLPTLFDGKNWKNWIIYCNTYNRSLIIPNNSNHS